MAVDPTKRIPTAIDDAESVETDASRFESGLRPRRWEASDFVDEKEDDAAIDLYPHQRARISEMYEMLDSLDFYALLGVPHDAEKIAIKRAYFEHVAEFHPDRFFRKYLGSYQPKLDAVFARL